MSHPRRFLCSRKHSFRYRTPNGRISAPFDKTSLVFVGASISYLFSSDTLLAIKRGDEGLPRWLHPLQKGLACGMLGVEQKFLIDFFRGGHPSPLRDREEPRPPFAYRVGLGEKEEIPMRQQRAYWYRCYPTPCQRQMLARTVCCARFVYNWALALRRRPTGSVVNRSFTRHLSCPDHLKQQEATAWQNASLLCTPTASPAAPGPRVPNFFEGRAKYPTFKKKHGRQSAEFTAFAFTWDGNDLSLAKMASPCPSAGVDPCPRTPGQAPSPSPRIRPDATSSPSWWQKISAAARHPPDVGSI